MTYKKYIKILILATVVCVHYTREKKFVRNESRKRKLVLKRLIHNDAKPLFNLQR